MTAFMLPAEVAHYLGIGVKAARRLMSTGAIRSERYAVAAGNARQGEREYWRTTFAAVEDYLDGFRTTTPTPPQRMTAPHSYPRPDTIIRVA